MTDNAMNTPKAATPMINRGDNITLQALLYAVACIQKLPEDRQERSNMVDMCSIARRIGGDDIALRLWSVEHHVGYEIDLWPAHGGDAPDGLYTDEEIDRRDAVRAWIKYRKARFAKTGLLADAPPSEVVTFIDGPENVEGEATQIEAFMSSMISTGGNADTPADMLRAPGADIGMDLVADQWIEQIVASDDPDAEFSQLIDHLSGVLANVELVQKHYRLRSQKAA